MSVGPTRQGRGAAVEDDDLKLYLLRHGESTANVEGVFAARLCEPPLNGRGGAGLRQAAGHSDLLDA